MIETFLGTLFLCVIIITILLAFIQYIGIKIGSKTYEDEVTYIGDYVQSIIIFLAISSFVLLFYVHLYYAKSIESDLYNSGLLFLVYGVFSGIIIQAVYYITMHIIQFFNKNKSTYFLKAYEKNWTWIFILITYAIYFISQHLYSYGFSYIALVLSYFFWMMPTKSTFKDKLKELKTLSISYWCCFVFVFICGFVSIRYTKPPYSIAAFIGIIIGFILGIICMILIAKKMKKGKTNSITI